MTDRMKLYLPSSLLDRIEGTEVAQWLVDHYLQAVGLPILPRYSKQTRAFLRTCHRETRIVHALKRRVSHRRVAAYKRKPKVTHHKWRFEHGTIKHYIVYQHGYEVLVQEPREPQIKLIELGGCYDR